MAEWQWAIHALKLVIQGRPNQSPVVFPGQELAVSALITTPLNLETELNKNIEAFVDVRNSNDVSLLSEPLKASLSVHPSFPNVFALHAPLVLSQAGSYTLLVAIVHSSRPHNPIRSLITLDVLKYA